MKDNTLRRCRQDIKAMRDRPGLTLYLRLWRLYHNLCLCTCVLCATVFDHIYLIFWLEIVQMRISRLCFWLCQLQSLDSFYGISQGSLFKKIVVEPAQMTNQTLTDAFFWYFLHTVALICYFTPLSFGFLMFSGWDGRTGQGSPPKREFLISLDCLDSFSYLSLNFQVRPWRAEEQIV